MSFVPQSPYRVEQPDWSKNAVIYQINTRQFSEGGNFEGILPQLSRLRELGVDILWLMPIHPIGHKHRKGPLGSPYAVKDYYGINSEFGTSEDFRTLINAIHALGMRVILDWVPNHSAWDNDLVTRHPDWYAKDYKGDFRPCPWWDWEDIIEFDYNHQDMRTYMAEAMAYWVREYDIDGFRCDVAGYIPNDFWHQVSLTLSQVKPVFMLAEWENRDLHEQAFNMTYAWSWHEALWNLAQGKGSLDKVRKYYAWNERAWPKSAYRMTFVSNHDENAWDGTQHEKFGKLLAPCIALSVLGEGMPLIYNGQEAGESKRLAFFDRDPIEWQSHWVGELYGSLIRLKKAIPALWNGEFGATMIQVPNSQQTDVLSFVREQDGHKVFVVLNFSHGDITATFHDNLFHGDYVDPFSDESVTCDGATEITLKPGGFRVLVQGACPSVG